MTLQTETKDIKQIFLLVLSTLVVFVISWPLFQSLDAPQVQGRLELAQSALVLQVSELEAEGIQQELLNGLLRGQNVQQDALEQYRQAIALAESNLPAPVSPSSNRPTKPLPQKPDAPEAPARKSIPAPALPGIDPSPPESIAANLNGAGLSAAELAQQRQELVQLRLEAGILAASQQQPGLAKELWQGAAMPQAKNFSNPKVQKVQIEPAPEVANPTVTNPTVTNPTELPAVLIGLWSDPPRLLPQVERDLRGGLTGWFRDQSLERLFSLSQRQEDLDRLHQERQAKAASALVRLGVVSAIPGAGIVLGTLLWLIFGVTAWRRRSQETAPFRLRPWTVPWSGLTIWFGVSLGFFLVGQLVVSTLAGGLVGTVIQNLNSAATGSADTGAAMGATAPDPAALIRVQAIGVFFSYGAMAIAVLAFLYILLKRHLPLAPDWFRLSFRGGHWFAWGLGGYLMAYPPVLLVSALNAQLWQGKGGSNPLLSLALENRDNVALLFFFVTAAIAAPLFEEIFFRGFLMTSLNRYLPPWGAVVASGGIFALVHLSFSEVLPLMTLGIMLGFVYGRSRNLLASILLHGLWNSGTLISLFLLGSALS